MTRHVLIILFVGASALCSAQSPLLTLREYLLTVEREHPALVSANYEPDIAEAEIRSALGRFDPYLSVDYVSKMKSGNDKLSYLDGSIELPLDMMFGPKLKANYRRGQGFSLDPENTTPEAGEASFGFSLPIFQGIFTDSRRNALRKAFLRPDIARAQYLIERNALLRAASMRYWEWSEAVSLRVIADSLVEIARSRKEFVRKRVLAGETAAIDSIEALQEVYRREGERTRSLRTEEQSYVDLMGFVWSNRQPVRLGEFSSEPLPSGSDVIVVRDSARSIARVLRPEVKRASLLIETSRLDSSLASEFMRPFVELNAGLISYDVSAPTSVDYKIGLNIKQPLLFRQASAQLQTSTIAVDRAEISRDIIQRIVEIDAENASIAVTRAKERLSFANGEVETARAMVLAEQSKFLAGDSSLLLINLRERFLAEALQRLVTAKADVARALVALAWATGVI